ncbi:MAG: response regulator [Theionarchaea archaeon]|nr:response regulator [Theionarchaea archaeon]
MKTHILVVEDERIVAEDIRRSLETLGYAVTAVVSSGEEALQKAAEENPDLVLMDIVLKGDMDGIEAAQVMNSRFNIPVVYLTAYADDRKLQRAMVTGPYGYILKPFEDRELRTTIEMALYKHKMEKKLKESEQWLATTLKSIGDGVITTDTEGIVTFINPVAETLTGWTQDEAVGSPLSEVFHIINEETRERCENPFEKIKTGLVVGLANNTVLVARDGTERLIADSGAPISDDHTILGSVLVFRDVTEKKRMEEDILRLKTEKMESIGILAGGIAHDFNNILTAILGNISLAKVHMNADNEVYRILKEAEKASLRARHLTQQLLMFSKDGAPVKKPACIGELLQDTAEFALRGSSIRCEFCIPDDLWNVNIDTGQISQVINNLIINAAQAMPHGGVVEVHAENVEAGEEEGLPIQKGDYVRISIADEGIGIPEENLQKIFDPYFTTKRKGSGLGLTTAYSIIKNHDGYIHAASLLGKGTVFYLWLPASAQEVVREEIVPAVPLMTGKGRILLMDDDESILGVTRDVLTHLGYEVVFARDGLEAIDAYKNARKTAMTFDVVIVDLTIRGGLGGRETIRKLMEIDPDVKAIVSSGYSNNPVITNFKKYGFSGAVAKPYSVEELSRILQEVLQD